MRTLTQTAIDQATWIAVLVLDLVVEVFDALGHLLLVDGVVDVEVVQVGVGQVGVAVLAQLGRAGHRTSVRAWNRTESVGIFSLETGEMSEPPSGDYDNY